MEPDNANVEPRNNSRILAAELVGTLVLMLGGPGVAILLPTLGMGVARLPGWNSLRPA